LALVVGALLAQLGTPAIDEVERLTDADRKSWSSRRLVPASSAARRVSGWLTPRPILFRGLNVCALRILVGIGGLSVTVTGLCLRIDLIRKRRDEQLNGSAHAGKPGSGAAPRRSSPGRPRTRW